jgi:hypothetical protein
MWRELVQRYALRAREFSDAVASLGHQAHLGSQEPRGLLDEIRIRQKFCTEVADEIDRYLKQKAKGAQT